MPRIPLRKNDDFYEESVLACSSHFPITCGETIVDEEKMERAMGIEPTYQAWEARVLPLNYARRLLFRRGAFWRWPEEMSRYRIVSLHET